MSRLKIMHKTSFSYEAEVGASYNEARMLPGSDDGQLVLQSTIRIHPLSSVQEFVDYWGTRVASFDVQRRHTELDVTAESLVEVWHAEHSGGHYTWAELGACVTQRVDLVEQLEQSPRTEPTPDIVELATTVKNESALPCDAALRIATLIGERMEYVPGVTGVNSTAAEAWGSERGVCQDIAHVVLGALRAAGIPARYVSGYLHPSIVPVVGEVVKGESHAWVEWFCGGVWRGFDPTNLIDIVDRHVSVARGRDYDDIAPLKGVYAGASSSELSVVVEVSRVG